MTITSMSSKIYMDKSDEQFLVALKSISNIEVRPWPQGIPYTFSEEFTSDVRQVNRFCRKKNIFGWSSKYISEHWDIVCLLSQEFFFYYLPSILLTMLEQPKSNLSKALIGGKLMRLCSSYSNSESRAVEEVVKYVAMFGINPEAIRARNLKGKEFFHGPDALLLREQYDAENSSEFLGGLNS